MVGSLLLSLGAAMFNSEFISLFCHHCTYFPGDVPTGAIEQIKLRHYQSLRPMVPLGARNMETISTSSSRTQNSHRVALQTPPCRFRILDSESFDKLPIQLSVSPVLLVFRRVEALLDLEALVHQESVVENVEVETCGVHLTDLEVGGNREITLKKNHYHFQGWQEERDTSRSSLLTGRCYVI